MPPVRGEMQIGETTFPVFSMNTLVVGSGAAGLNAALQLRRRGQHDVVIVTRHWGAGASFEAGSDKQTYYKLSVAHDIEDSPARMAEVLFGGGCMHGDIALCEAQHSAEAFFHLVSLGVPFPHDRYGAYVGYRTDNDPAARATSAGPLTSRYMCECLSAAIEEDDVPVFDNHQVIALLVCDDVEGSRVCGALAIDTRDTDNDRLGFVVFNAVNVILATGGPGGMYRASVYPGSQMGATGLGLAVGAEAQNLTESQFGLASVSFRWNMSGSYQQSIPRYVSTDADGKDEREFLNEYFPTMATLAAAVFRKGYEWPFDAGKVADGGSSLIDLLVYREIMGRSRRVFLDYTRDADGGGVLPPLSLEMLTGEAHRYLSNSGAVLETPIRRLRAMNEPAYGLFRKHGIDLVRDYLEIAVCAQHSNGGLVGNIWWESNIRHLFPIGEVNGSHGVRRPGGAALNAGQVGGIRAAMFISKRYGEPPPDVQSFAASIAPQIRKQWERARQMVAAGDEGAHLSSTSVTREIQERMSACAGILRYRKQVEDATWAAWKLTERAGRELRVPSAAKLPDALQALDLCLTHVAYLEALREYLARGGASRGSFLVVHPDGVRLHEKLPDSWRFMPPKASLGDDARILQIRLAGGRAVRARWIDPRPIPRMEGWFETAWDDYRHDRVVR